MKNRIDPELRENLEAVPPIDLDNLEATRQAMTGMLDSVEIPTDESVTISNRMIPGPAGDPEVRVRIYEPKQKSKALPGLLWIHGGGYVVGIPEMNEVLCQRFVTEANCVVVSVDYRLAPEHPYPAAIEDCYASLQWFANHADELAVDGSRIGIAGASAGGGLTAALALLARDRKGPDICFQMPLYPMINDFNNITIHPQVSK